MHNLMVEARIYISLKVSKIKKIKKNYIKKISKNTILL